MDEREMEKRYRQRAAVGKQALQEKGRLLVDAMLEVQRSGDFRHYVSETQKARKQPLWSLVACVAVAFTTGFMAGSLFEQMKDTPHVMHPQEATHGQ